MISALVASDNVLSEAPACHMAPTSLLNALSYYGFLITFANNNTNTSTHASFSTILQAKLA